MNTLYLFAPHVIGTIAPEIYGHFSEHIGGVFYDGLWVGRDSAVPNIRGFRKDLVEKLAAVRPAVLRWPGGCFAETYDWRDGIGEDRPVRRNWWTNDDGRYESNAVGTHEFLDLCELIGAKPYFAANITSTTPQDIRDWMDYCLSPRGTTALACLREKNGHPEPWDIPFWGVGNENWGGGGNMRPERYADEYRRYATIMHNFAPKAELYACGSNGRSPEWTRGVTEVLRGSWSRVDGFAMHYYCGSAGDPLTFSAAEWTELIGKAQRMEEILCRNWDIIRANELEERMKLVVDEWGCWHPGGSGPSKGYNLFEQQSTMRDAMVAALTLNIFNRHCDKVRMANIAQLVNNLHCLFLAGGENCIVTPTYHVYDLFKGHQGGQAIETLVQGGGAADISVSASVREDRLLVTLGNLSCTEDREITLAPVGVDFRGTAEAALLYDDDMHAHNTFEDPERVKPAVSPLDPSRSLTLPRAGILAVTLPLA